MGDSPRPPRIGQLLLHLRRLPEHQRDEIEADLLELFAIREIQRGRGYARWRYCADALSLWGFRQSAVLDEPRRHHERLHDMRQDILFAARLFQRQPGLFGVTIAGLALAIGISTAVFSIVNAAAFRGSGISAPESVFRIALANGRFTQVTGNSPTQGNWQYSDYRRLQQATSSFGVVAAASVGGQFREAADAANLPTVGVLAVSGNYFQVLGGRASAGRTLAPGDDVPGAPPVVVLSHAFWKNRLGSDPSIVGRTVWLSDLPFTVVGIAERRFTGQAAMDAPAFWMTLNAHSDVWKAQQDVGSPIKPFNPAVDVLGRVGQGTSRVQAEAEVTSIALALAAERGRTSATARPTVRLQPVDEQRDGATLMIIVAVIMAIVGLVVLLACANVTNLLLASAAGRRREIGTRLALGAGRGRVVRQLLTESLLLGLLGGTAGLIVTTWLTPWLAAVIQVPQTMDVSPDRFVYAFVAALTIAVGIMAGLAPARFSRRGDLISDLKTDQLAAPRPMPRSLLRSGLIGGQAAASVLLLVLAALLTRSLVHVSTFDLGFDAGCLLSVSVGSGTRGQTWDPIRTSSYWNAALAEVRQLPGVAGASLVSMPPFSGISVPSLPNGYYVHREESSADYFSSIGVRVLRGRTYSAEEVRAEAPVAVISATLAREFWGAEDPIGSSLERVWGPEDTGDTRFKGVLRKPKGTRVIGVVADAIALLQNHDAFTIYLPLSPRTVPYLVVRVQDDPHVVARPVQDVLRAIDPDVRPSVKFAGDGLQSELRGPRTLALLSSLVGACALGLAVIGLFGVTAFVALQRRHEVGVRMTLGATRRHILGMLLRDSLRPVVIGLACGLVLALLGGRLIQRTLYGVSAHDPLAILAAIAVLLLSALAAVLVPASRATRIDPAQILRQL